MAIYLLCHAACRKKSKCHAKVNEERKEKRVRSTSLLLPATKRTPQPPVYRKLLRECGGSTPHTPGWYGWCLFGCWACVGARTGSFCPLVGCRSVAASLWAGSAPHFPLVLGRKSPASPQCGSRSAFTKPPSLHFSLLSRPELMALLVQPCLLDLVPSAQSGKCFSGFKKTDESRDRKDGFLVIHFEKIRVKQKSCIIYLVKIKSAKIVLNYILFNNLNSFFIFIFLYLSVFKKCF